MKKQAKKVRLSKETLMTLAFVGGGSYAPHELISSEGAAATCRQITNSILC